MARPERIRLGDLLVREQLVTADQVQQALGEQQRSGRKLGRIFIDSGWVTEALSPSFTQAGAQGYLCGPPPMIDACIGVMASQGMDVEQVFFDKFADQAKPTG